MFSRSRRSMCKVWRLVCFVILPLCAVWGVLEFTLLSPRPLFHERVGIRNSVSGWYPIIPIIDRKGNYAYADFDSNYLVLIITAQSNILEGILPRRGRCPAEAILLGN